MPTTKPSPRTAAREMCELLAARANPKKAAEVQRYFKETVAAFGIPLPDVRVVAMDLHRAVRGSWTVEDAVVFCDTLIRDPHLESKAIALGLLAKYEKRLSPAHLPRLHEWIARRSGNWATVDEIAPHLVAPLVERHPEVLPEVVAWTASDVLWVRRAAAVAFVPHARRGKYLDTAYEIATRLLGDHEDLAHKAVGWLLREAGRTDRHRLERYLLEHGPRIPRTTLRYAIEHFPPKDRTRLMEATRG